jgi:hypothetical protein
MTTFEDFTAESVKPESKPSFLQRLFRALVTIFSSPKGDQGGWAAGARSF